jgi:hypothetical protein
VNRADRKRRAYFDRGMAGLRASYDIPADWPDAIYACPLCRRAFTAEALDLRLLTLEDVPPKSVGGRPITLTCKTCNNWSGTTLDPSVKQSAEIATLIKAMAGEGSASQAGSMTIAGQILRGKLNATPGRLFFENDPRRHDPAAFAALEAIFSRGIIPTSFHYRAARPHSSWLAGVGTVRIAYLAAFAKFGYRYAFSSHLDVSVSRQGARDRVLAQLC